MSNIGSNINEFGKAKDDFLESYRLLSGAAKDIAKSKYKEVIEDPSTGDPFYHIITEDGKEEMLKRKDIIENLKDCMNKLEYFKRELRRVPGDLDQGTIEFLKSSSKLVEEFKKQYFVNQD